jgi:DNA-binding MarR family transcriptional regulator
VIVSATRPREAGGGAWGEPLTPDELAAWRGFLRVHAALLRELDSELVATHGLSLSAYEVLLFLAEAPEGRMRMSDLAERVLLSRSGLTRLVDRLERARMVRREQCESDARGLNAVITPAGRRKFAAARRVHLAGVRARFLDPLGSDDKDSLAAIWERLRPGAATAPA